MKRKCRQRKMQMCIHFYKFIAEKASLGQIEVIIEDSTDIKSAERINLLKAYKHVIMLKTGEPLPKKMNRDTLYLSLRSNELYIDVQTYNDTGYKTIAGNEKYAIKDAGIWFDANKDLLISEPRHVAIVSSSCGYTQNENIYKEYCDYLITMKHEKSLNISNK